MINAVRISTDAKTIVAAVAQENRNGITEPFKLEKEMASLIDNSYSEFISALILFTADWVPNTRNNTSFLFYLNQ